MISRRKFVAAGAAIAAAARAPRLFAQRKERHDAAILFTNDLHGHVRPWCGWEGELKGKVLGGMDRIATIFHEARREVGGDNVLVLDAGDAWGDSLVAAETKGAAVVELMNLLGYDGMTIGNHEPDFGPEELRARINQAEFPVIAANLSTADGSPLTPPHFLRKLNGVTVGVFGVAYPKTPKTTVAKNVRGLTFGDPVEAARREVAALRENGAACIVALTHLGLSADLSLAEQVPGIDLILGGHSHNRTAAPRLVGQTTIMQAGAHGSDVGRVDLRFQSGRGIHFMGRLVAVDQDVVASDPAVAKRINELEAPYRDRLDQVIAQAADPITRAQTIAGRNPRKRNQESPADSLFADILREGTRSDIALLPGVGYGVSIPTGPILQGALANLLPHDSKAVTMTLTGGQVKEILERSLTNIYSSNPADKVGGMIQVSGIEFTYSPDAPDGRRITQCLHRSRPLEAAKSFRVVTNSLLAQGGHNYHTFAAGTDQRAAGTQFAIIADWMARAGSVRTPPPGRIRSSGSMDG